MSESGYRDHEPGDRRQHNLWGFLGRAATWLHEPIGPARESRTEEAKEPIDSSLAVIFDGGAAKRMYTILPQEGMVDFTTIMPRHPGDETLLLYSSVDAYSYEPTSIGYMVRCDDLDAEGRFQPVMYRIRPRSSDRAPSRFEEIVEQEFGGGYEVTPVDPTTLCDEDSSRLISLRGRHRRTLPDETLERIYVLRGDANELTAANDNLTMPGFFTAYRGILNNHNRG